MPADSLQRSYALIDISGWTLAEHNPFAMAVRLGKWVLDCRRNRIESEEENEPAPVKESKTRYAVNLGWRRRYWLCAIAVIYGC